MALLRFARRFPISFPSASVAHFGRPVHDVKIDDKITCKIILPGRLRTLGVFLALVGLRSIGSGLGAGRRAWS
jgi:hypothetical protein